MLVPANSEKIATRRTVEIVVECALLTVLEIDAHQTRPALQNRRHFFHDLPRAPFLVARVDDEVADAQVQAVSDGHGLTCTLAAPGQPARCRVAIARRVSPSVRAKSMIWTTRL